MSAMNVSGGFNDQNVPFQGGEANGGTIGGIGGSLSDQTADAIIANMLQEYGLDFSSAQVARWSNLIAANDANAAVIMEEIRQSPQFQTRFSGMQRRIDAGYDPISVEEYLDLEAGYASTMRAMGMPSTFYDSPDDFEEFIVNDVSVPELEQRVVQGYVAAQQAPQEVRDAMRDFYNIPNSDAALAAYYLDPDRALPAIEREFEAAQIAGAAEMTTFEGLTQEQAEEIAAMDVGFTDAQKRFTDLMQDESLFAGNLNRGGQISRDEQIAAMFRGDAVALAKIRRRREQRQSEFQGTTGGGTTATGVMGLGDTDTTS